MPFTLIIILVPLNLGLPVDSNALVHLDPRLHSGCALFQLVWLRLDLNRRRSRGCFPALIICRAEGPSIVNLVLCLQLKLGYITCQQI